MSHHRRDRHPPTALPQAKFQTRSANQPEVVYPGSFPSLLPPLDKNADRLMDEVFGDIERMLERGTQLQPDTARDASPPPEPSAAFSGRLDFSESGLAPHLNSPSLASSLALLPKLSPRQLTQEEDPVNSNAAPEETPNCILKPTPTENSQPEKGQSADQWLMGVAFVSLVLASGVWGFVHYYLPKAPAIVNAPSAAEVLQAKHDAEFLNYVQRAMERIDRASKQAKASANSATDALPSALPPLYVPLPPPPAVATLPFPPSAAPSPAARVSVAPLPPISTAPLAPAPASPVPATAIPNIAPSPTHVLLGLLELGDRSAALFEINGAPQRIQVGESIGSSGWALVAVSGEEAIVRRNGEVRSVYIGQRF